MTTSLILWVAFYLSVRWASIANGGHALAWDVAWYAEIARNGYTFNGNPNQSQLVGFLPLYPLVLRFFLRLGLEIEWAVLVAPILLSTVGLWLMYKAIAHIIPIAEAFLLVLLFVASPFSMYFLNGYSECLYVFFLGAFFYLMLLKNRPFLAALAAGMATAVRPHAVVLYAVYVTWMLDREWPKSKRFSDLLQKIILIAPIFLVGLFLTCEYYYFEFGDLFLFKNIMISWGFDQVADGFGAQIDHFRSQFIYLLVPDLRALTSGFAPEIAKFQLWSFVLLAFVFGKQIPKPILAYGLMVVAFSLLATIGSVNLGRHMATNIALPALFVAIFNVLRNKTSRYLMIGILLLVGLTLQALYLNRFFMSQWVS